MFDYYDLLTDAGVRAPTFCDTPEADLIDFIANAMLAAEKRGLPHDRIEAAHRMALIHFTEESNP